MGDKFFLIIRRLRLLLFMTSQSTNCHFYTSGTNPWKYSRLLLMIIITILGVVIYLYLKQYSSFEFAMTAELKKWRRIFTGLASVWSNIFTNSNEKKTCLIFCLLFICKFQTLTCRNFWIFYFHYHEVNPVWMCHLCLYSVIIKLDYWFRK